MDSLQWDMGDIAMGSGALVVGVGGRRGGGGGGGGGGEADENAMVGVDDLPFMGLGGVDPYPAPPLSEDAAGAALRKDVPEEHRKDGGPQFRTLPAASSMSTASLFGSAPQGLPPPLTSLATEAIVAGGPSARPLQERRPSFGAPDALHCRTAPSTPTHSWRGDAAAAGSPASAAAVGGPSSAGAAPYPREPVSASVVQSRGGSTPYDRPRGRGPAHLSVDPFALANPGGSAGRSLSLASSPAAQSSPRSPASAGGGRKARSLRDRRAHNEEEMRRRHRLRDSFEQLRGASQCEKKDRFNILVTAVRVIGDLRRRVVDLEAERLGTGLGAAPSSQGAPASPPSRSSSPHSSSLPETGVAMARCQANGTFVEANGAFAAMLGYPSAASVAGLNLFAVTAPGDAVRATCVMVQHLMSGGGAAREESWESYSTWQTASRQAVPVHVTASAALGPAGRDGTFVIAAARRNALNVEALARHVTDETVRQVTRTPPGGTLAVPLPSSPDAHSAGGSMRTGGSIASGDSFLS